MATGGYRNGVQKPPNLRTSSSFKSKLPPSNARRSTPASLAAAADSGRVRVAVRLRPQNAEELVADADFADCVELQPELKRLKLRKNNWDSDTYEFDEVLTEFASQKRVYEVVAKPVVEVHIKRSVSGRDDEYPLETQNRSNLVGNLRPPMLRKGKLIVVDLAGSERIHKSGTSRTSLVVTIGPSPRHRAETASTILFGQREEKMKCQMDYMESIKKLEEKWTVNQQKHAINGEVHTGDVNEEVAELKTMLQNETRLRKAAEEEIQKLKSQLLKFSKMEARSYLDSGNSGNPLLGLDCFTPLNHLRSREGSNGERASITNLHEQVGLQKILSLLESEDANVRIHAVKVVANLAAEESNQELIMAQGGICLLAMTAADAEDPQTLRMVAGAIANLCGNGTREGRSLLIEDGALPWIVQNANNEASLIRRHVELALCHLAQHEVNAKDMISGGALWELVRISRDCSREDIRALARRTLASSSTFQAEMRRLRIEV
ncbi:UNVERIFIED_CONTAM: Kinesin-like protein KIN-UB [Sesamum latifolium]|uniref:Kinesin-like protein n=1 Tax=Sesamum latifolium TaxID=2727402 RepID=A0AAW2YGA9_9LAMI